MHNGRVATSVPRFRVSLDAAACVCGLLASAVAGWERRTDAGRNHFASKPGVRRPGAAGR